MTLRPCLTALMLLGAVLPVRAAALDDAVRDLQSADSQVREQAAARLGQPGPQAAAAVAPLVAALGHDDPYLRGAAAVALGRLGAPALPALMQLLSAAPDADDLRRREAATIALGRLGLAAAPALPALRAQLAHPGASLRQLSATALGELGPLAREAAPALTRALSDRDEAVRHSARQALARIAPEDRARQLQPEALVATLDALVPQLLAEHQVPGLAIALIRDRQLVWSKGYGLRHAGAPEPVTPDTVFEAASMSKPVLALLAMQFVDAGRLALDRPLSADGPESPAPLPDAPDKRLVTARMLLSHTAGYPNWRPGGEEGEGPLPLLFRPGARFSYSGEGIFLLQRRLEQIGGQGLAPLAQDRLLGPLGLQHSGFAWTPALGAAQAGGHGPAGQPLPAQRYAHPNAAYTLYTSAKDYARLLAEVLRAGQGGSPLLSAAAVGEMLRPQVALVDRPPIERPGAAQGESVHWGLGWSINATAQGDIAHHSGINSTGYCSFSQFSPSRGSGLVLLSNGARGDEVWRRLVAAIGDL